MSPLDDYLGAPVSKLVMLPAYDISPEMQERHRIYCLLLMAIVAFNFCGKRSGAKDTPAPIGHGKNPILPEKHIFATRGTFLERDYIGHNIAAIAVDRNGHIIDFDFNHNELFNSSIEHAEARLLNRLFKLSKIHDSWAIGPQPSEPPAAHRYGNALSGVTIYTSLESCAQCSGIMTLGNVNEVVYLQEDPGQYKIGNIMYNLTPRAPGEKHSAPRPIPASEVSFAFFDKLNAAYKAFEAKHGKGGLTSFLCTDAAYQIFLEAERPFIDYTVIYPGVADCKASRLTNAGVKVECQTFYQYVVDKGRRGTPH